MRPCSPVKWGSWTDPPRGCVGCSQPERGTLQGWKAVKSLSGLQRYGTNCQREAPADVMCWYQLSTGKTAGETRQPLPRWMWRFLRFWSFASALTLSSASISWRSDGRAMSGRDMPVPWNCCTLCVTDCADRTLCRECCSPGHGAQVLALDMEENWTTTPSTGSWYFLPLGENWEYVEPTTTSTTTCPVILGSTFKP